MSEHDDLTEAREALRRMCAAPSSVTIYETMETVEIVSAVPVAYVSTILAALDGHAAALSAARREGAAEAFERAAKVADEQKVFYDGLAEQSRAEAEVDAEAEGGAPDACRVRRWRAARRQAAQAAGDEVTRRVAALVLVAACAGCAATNGGGRYGATAQAARSVASRSEAAAPADSSGSGGKVNTAASKAAAERLEGSSPSSPTNLTNAPADSVWLTFTVPALGSPNGCEPDTTLQHDARTVDVLKLNTAQPPFYRRGCEADTACWDSVRAFNVPALVARLERLAPGQRCSVRVAAGLHTTITSNPVGASCWSRGARVGQ